MKNGLLDVTGSLLGGSLLAGTWVGCAAVSRVCEGKLMTSFCRPETVVLRLAAEAWVGLVVEA